MTKRTVFELPTGAGIADNDFSRIDPDPDSDWLDEVLLPASVEGRESRNIPIPRQGTVEECSAMVVFLASEQASYITGQAYLVNGGAHFL